MSVAVGGGGWVSVAVGSDVAVSPGFTGVVTVGVGVFTGPACVEVGVAVGPAGAV